MIDLLLWLGDRLELSIPVTLAVVVVAVLGVREWKRRRSEPASSEPVSASGDAQQAVVAGNRVGGDLKIKQER